MKHTTKRRPCVTVPDLQPAPVLAEGMTFTRIGMLPITVVSLHEYGALCEDSQGTTAFLTASFFKGWHIAD